MHKGLYLSKEYLGRGTFGSVYRCIDINKQECCVKEINVNGSNIAIVLAQEELIRNEIYFLSSLKHPRIVRFISAYEIAKYNQFFITMEYAPKGSLHKFIRSRRKGDFLTQKDILKYFCDILMGLEYLHMKDVIHKDLKSENILMFENNRLKIADFGLSLISSSVEKSKEKMDVDEKANTKPCGTPLYMSPEALVHNEFSFASDIWALGCIFYELCMLRQPFQHCESMEDLRHAISKAAFFHFEPRKHGWDGEFAHLCNLMLTPNEKERVILPHLISKSIITEVMYPLYFDFTD